MGPPASLLYSVSALTGLIIDCKLMNLLGSEASGEEVLAERRQQQLQQRRCAPVVLPSLSVLGRRYLWASQASLQLINNIAIVVFFGCLSAHTPAKPSRLAAGDGATKRRLFHGRARAGWVAEAQLFAADSCAAAIPTAAARGGHWAHVCSWRRQHSPGWRAGAAAGQGL